MSLSVLNKQVYVEIQWKTPHTSTNAKESKKKGETWNQCFCLAEFVARFEKVNTFFFEEVFVNPTFNPLSHLFRGLSRHEGDKYAKSVIKE